MGRPPHSLLPSICFRVSLNAVLLVLTDGKKEGTSAHPAGQQFVAVYCSLLTAVSAASSVGRSRWSSRRCRAQSGGQRGSEQYR